MFENEYFSMCLVLGLDEIGWIHLYFWVGSNSFRVLVRRDESDPIFSLVVEVE